MKELTILHHLVFSWEYGTYPKTDFFKVGVRMCLWSYNLSYKSWLDSLRLIIFILIICQGGFSSVQSLSRVRLFATPWTAPCQASLSISNSRRLLKLVSIESVMPSNHLILSHPVLLPPSIFPSIRVFSKESVLRIRWPIYWSFSISPSSEYSGLISFRIGLSSNKQAIK